MFRDTLYESKKLPQQPRHPPEERRKTELSRRADIKGFNGRTGERVLRDLSFWRRVAKPLRHESRAVFKVEVVARRLDENDLHWAETASRE